jgi:hypothetical protein
VTSHHQLLLLVAFPKGTAIAPVKSDGRKNSSIQWLNSFSTVLFLTKAVRSSKQANCPRFRPECQSFSFPNQAADFLCSTPWDVKKFSRWSLLGAIGSWFIQSASE